ncbi:hypothetical protein JOD97_004020 [Duganella sp. 1411]|uniref:hypothetical protein n=1 Tax=Duganella sp. 1411 TaxID=2806572 RepID=UPI001AE203FC|nr:hypothetical protein [Duganella sp. 1411]MBP1205958.1 hypothetical protein [Duganella sp. 1411]
MPRTLLVAALLAGCAAGAANAVVSPAAFNKVAPPPGLYRIDSDGTLRMPDADATIRQKQDGASGDVSVSATQKGQGYQRDFKGAGAQTYCLPPRSGKAAILPPEMGAAACKNIAESITDTTLVTESQCSIGKVKVTIRKLGNDTWEVLHEGDMKASPGGADMNAMRPMLENAARNAPTAEQRAQAKQLLADLPRQQAAMQAALAETKAALIKEQASATSAAEKAEIGKQLQAMEQGGPRMRTSSRTLWTRIGDSCAAPAR